MAAKMNPPYDTVVNRPSAIKINNAALEDSPDGSIRLRGTIDNDSLRGLLFDNYQREIIPGSKVQSLMGAFETGGGVPDIELGMRGQKYVEKDGSFILKDHVFVIDGRQRTNAAILLLDAKKKLLHPVGAKVNFSTTYEYEAAKFRTMNFFQSRVSGNILLRNLKEENDSIEMLFNLCYDSTFVLYRKISWDQYMARGNLLKAMTFCKTIASLHRFTGVGVSTQYEQLANSLDRVKEAVGRNIMRNNTIEFFNIIDSCWGLKHVVYRDSAAFVKGNFMTCLARLFSEHYDFWKGPNETRLFIEAPLMRKLKMFPVNDPGVQSLAGSGGKSADILYRIMLDHINSGKRTKHLRARAVPVAIDDDDDGEEC